jgi:polyphosphate kinase 2 (PPK2 family)
MLFIKSLLSEQGELVIFEHNPYNPVTVRAVNTCPFDKNAVLLKPNELRKYIVENGMKIEKTKFCLFFPAFLKRFRFIEKYISAIPLGGQYFILAKLKNSTKRA